MPKTYRAIGLMSGTSIDGIDVALIETDGIEVVKPISSQTYPYDEDFKTQLQSCFHNQLGTADPKVAAVETALTLLHAKAIKDFLAQRNVAPQTIDLIGFHGQTIWHDPARGETIQIGDGALLAAETGIDVVNDFRTADVKAGGQGAPLLPLYHRALACALPKPVAIVNIGGIANLTWIGGNGDDEIAAFDTGPGNALINDWMMRNAGEPFDKDGQHAAQGRVDQNRLMDFLVNTYFMKKGPKSLDRDTFMRFMPTGLSPEDGAATLTMMTVQSIAHGIREAGKLVSRVYLCGGGAHNLTIRKWLSQATGAQVDTVGSLGWNADGLEAEGFAYLAVRSLLGLPISLPRTTGVPRPMTGGTLHKRP